MYCTCKCTAYCSARASKLTARHSQNRSMKSNDHLTEQTSAYMTLLVKNPPNHFAAAQHYPLAVAWNVWEDGGKAAYSRRRLSSVVGRPLFCSLRLHVYPPPNLSSCSYMRLQLRRMIDVCQLLSMTLHWTHEGACPESDSECRRGRIVRLCSVPFKWSYRRLVIVTRFAIREGQVDVGAGGGERSRRS